jgi:hypothetical protein
VSANLTSHGAGNRSGEVGWIRWVLLTWQGHDVYQNDLEKKMSWVDHESWAGLLDGSFRWNSTGKR